MLGFAALQLLDALSTWLFLRLGVSEANPLLRGAIALAGNRALALAATKLCAMAPAWYAWRTGRRRLLRGMNLLYGAIVGWNLLAVVLKAVAA